MKKNKEISPKLIEYLHFIGIDIYPEVEKAAACGAFSASKSKANNDIGRDIYRDENDFSIVYNDTEKSYEINDGENNVFYVKAEGNNDQEYGNWKVIKIIETALELEIIRSDTFKLVALMDTIPGRNNTYFVVVREVLVKEKSDSQKLMLTN